MVFSLRVRGWRPRHLETRYGRVHLLQARRVLAPDLPAHATHRQR